MKWNLKITMQQNYMYSKIFCAGIVHTELLGSIVWSLGTKCTQVASKGSDRDLRVKQKLSLVQPITVNKFWLWCFHSMQRRSLHTPQTYPPSLFCQSKMKIYKQLNAHIGYNSVVKTQVLWYNYVSLPEDQEREGERERERAVTVSDKHFVRTQHASIHIDMV